MSLKAQDWREQESYKSGKVDKSSQNYMFKYKIFEKERKIKV